ncbi:MAG: bifunctional hydroxymethylpyrimidine kinase/phosphomethylpyrimidine kinase [Arcobacteraceae bacterium]|jgi:hydroxymethylpyrimidine/phosphomethylpyrimidine kinase
MKVILSIAGSDSGGCAGIQADIKTAEAFGCFSTTCITVLTAQNTTGVKEIYPVNPDFIKSQLEAIFEDYNVSAVKTGMLFDKEIIETVTSVLVDKNIPIVVDPVCISRSGDKLLKDDAIEAYEKLFALSTVVTPNFYEACYILNANDTIDIINNANRFITKHNTALLIKQFPKNNQFTTDTLIDAKLVEEFSSPTVDTKHNNGTGCSYSTAIACGLANGKTLDTSISDAKDFIYNALLHSPALGHGNGAIGHKKGIM